MLWPANYTKLEKPIFMYCSDVKHRTRACFFP